MAKCITPLMAQTASDSPVDEVPFLDVYQLANSESQPLS